MDVKSPSFTIASCVSTRAMIDWRSMFVRGPYQHDEHAKGPASAGASSPGPLAQEGAGGEHVISLRELLGVMWRRLDVILLAAVVLAVAVLSYDLFVRAPQYEASIKMFIDQEEGGETLGSAVQGLTDVTVTMAEAVGTRSVAQGAIERLDLSMTPDELLNGLSAEQAAETQFIDISYTNPGPQQAQRIVNAVGMEFSDRISEVTTNSLTATVWDRAAVPQAPSSPNPARDAAFAAVVGALLGIALAFLLEHLDNSWRSLEEVEQVSGMPTFGVIPEFNPSKLRGRV